MKAKQIEDVLDMGSAQEVTGEKLFAAPQTFFGDTKSLVIANGYLYWVNDPTMLDEKDNTRLSMKTGTLITESYNEGRWSIV